MQKDIIVALATSNSQSGAIGIIRLSGKCCIKLVDTFVNIDILSRQNHTINFCKIFDSQKNIIDEVLVSIFFEDHSYTGEESVEISCHNSTYIIKEIISVFVKSGARVANPGEFTKRAFENGKLDLAQAESVADLIASKSKSAHDVAMQQMSGVFSKKIEKIKSDVVSFASKLETTIDFSDEDINFSSKEDLLNDIDAILNTIKTILKNFERGEVIKSGLPIAIVGKPNTGKSSLLNLLLNEDRAIVSPIAGTTRDTIDAEINIGDINCRFIDTAGLRDNTDDEIEKIGIEKTKKTIEKAKLILYVTDINSDTKEYKHDLIFINKLPKDVLVLVNKIDLNPNYKIDEDCIYISVKNNIGIDKLKKYITEKYSIHEDEIIVNARHFDILNRSLNLVMKIKSDLINNVSNEFLMLNVNEVINLFNNITGKTTSNDILDEIFSHFCIGK